MVTGARGTGPSWIIPGFYKPPASRLGPPPGRGRSRVTPLVTIPDLLLRPPSISLPVAPPVSGVRRLCAGALLVAVAWAPAAWAQVRPAGAASAPAAGSSGSLKDQPVHVEADAIEGRPDQGVTATGDVKLRQGPMTLTADRVSYDQPTDTARGSGNVRLATDDGNWLSGPEVQIAVHQFEGFFSSPEYFIAPTRAGGRASRWDFHGRDHAEARDLTYTSCNRDDPEWLLTADHVELDFEKNEGRARGAVLRFYDVPILAAPTFTFPLSDDRKSGWLPPSPTLDSKGGFQFAMPYYWNIAPNRDMTLVPVISAKRGVGLESEFRYLQPAHEGIVRLHSLPNDALTGDSRGALRLLLEGALPGDTLYKLDGLRVSDNDYWKDFPRNVASLTPRLLGTDLTISRHFERWTPYARIKTWQVLQDSDLSEPLLVAPYDRLPQVGVRTVQPIPGGLQFGFETEYNRFANPHGYMGDPRVQELIAAGVAPRATGERVHALGSVSWPYLTPGWSFVPKFGVNAASYQLDQPIANGPYQGQTKVSRAIPSFSLDSAWTFERDADWFGRDVRQTLEPRVLYVRTAYRQQAGLPNFDSAVRDFNVDSIYTENAFSGVDRVSDANQVTAGVTTRVLDAQTGAENVRLGIAQRVLFSDQRVAPDDGDTITQSVSDVLLFGSSNLSKRWYLDAALQYSHDLRRMVRSVVGARYTAPDYRTVGLAYRYKAGETEQVDFSWQWPLYGPARRERLSGTGTSCGGGWYTAGRVNYSMLESRVTEAVAAVEYDSGCWVGRVLARRQSTSTREATTQVGLEVEFVGLSRLGTNNPTKVLKDNIPGYRPLRDDPDAPAAP